MPKQYLDVFLTKEDFMLKDVLRGFVDKEIMPVRQQIDDDKEHKIVNKILQGLTDLGLQKAAFSRGIGGDGAADSAVGSQRFCMKSFHAVTAVFAPPSTSPAGPGFRRSQPIIKRFWIVSRRTSAVKNSGWAVFP